MATTFLPSNSIQIINSGTKIKEGDTKTVFKIKLLDSTGTAVDLTGASAKVYFSRLSDNLLLLSKSAIVGDDGTVSFHFDVNDATGNGQIKVQINVTYTDNSVEKFPASDFGYIFIDPSIDNLDNVTLSSYTLQQIIDSLTTSFTTSLNATKTDLQNTIESLPLITTDDNDNVFLEI